MQQPDGIGHQVVMSSDTARENWADVLSAAQWQGRVTVITRHGKPVAKVAPVTEDGGE